MGIQLRITLGTFVSFSQERSRRVFRVCVCVCVWTRTVPSSLEREYTSNENRRHRGITHRRQR